MKWDLKLMTDIGNVRETNEDGFYISGMRCAGINHCNVDIELRDHFLCAVVDGVGGCAHGEVATQLVIDKMDTHAIPSSEESIVQMLDDLNKTVSEAAERIETACTIAGMCVLEDKCFWFNIGDSRVYEISHGYLNQLSTDDTASGLSGDLSEGKEPLLQYLGKKGLVPHVGTARNTSSFLLCTDGLSDMVSLDDIEDIIASSGRMELGDNLINAAKKAGGNDNVTLLIIRPALEE